MADAGKKIVITISKAAYKNLTNMALDHDTRISTYLTEQIEKKFGTVEEEKKEEPKPTSRKRLAKRDEEAEQE